MTIEAFAQPPHVNFPGRMLSFSLNGWRGGDDGVEPRDLAASIRAELKTLYTEVGATEASD